MEEKINIENNEIKEENTNTKNGIEKVKYILFSIVAIMLCILNILMVRYAIHMTKQTLYWKDHFVASGIGESMEPTLHEDIRYLYEKYNGQPIERYQIISFIDERGNNLIKRVIGLPGDRVNIIDDIVYINGVNTHEDELAFIYPEPGTDHYNNFFQVPDNCYFVLGDNRNASGDSRFFYDPYISSDQIKGILIGEYDKQER